MKKISLILLLTISLFINNLMAQDTITVKYKSLALKPNEPTWLQHSAGYELRLASNHYYTGLAFVVGGGASLLGVIALVNANPSISNPLIFESICGLSVLTGSALMLESHIHIRRAGIILDRNGIGLAIKLGK